MAKKENQWKNLLSGDEQFFRVSILTKIRRMERMYSDADARLKRIEKRIFPESRNISAVEKRIKKNQIRFFLDSMKREGKE